MPFLDFPHVALRRSLGLFWLLLAVGSALSAPSLRAQATLVIDSTPRGAVIHVDGDRLGTAPQTVRTSAGRHAIRAVFAGYDTGERDVEVADGDTLRVRIDLTRQIGEIVLVDAPPDASFFVDEQFVPGRSTEQPVGSYDIRVERPGRRAIHTRVTVLPDEVAEIEYTTDARNRLVVAGALAFPGGVQLFDNRPGRGALFAALGGLAVGTAIAQHVRVREADADRLAALDRYAEATTETDAVAAREAAQDATDIARSARWARGGAALAFLATGALSAVDAYRHHAARPSLTHTPPANRVQVSSTWRSLTIRIPLR